MPTIPTMELPLPKDWQEFESLTRDAMASKWRSPNLQKNGRGGQSQHGIDIYGPDYLGRQVGVQCKKYKGALKLSTIEAEIKNAENFNGQLTTLFIATTAEHDSVLQEQVRAISEQRSLQGKFAVGILFWDEIIAGLLLNPALVTTYFPNLVLNDPVQATTERQLAALELGYFGADIWDYVLLVHGEIGQIVQSDPDELAARLQVLAHRAQQILPPEHASEIVGALNATRNGCASKKTSESDWDPVEVNAKRASKRIASSSSLVALEESRVLELGIQLGRIYHHSDEIPNERIRSQVQEKLLAILGTAEASAIKDAIDNANSLNAGYHWATRLYGFVDRKLRYRA